MKLAIIGTDGLPARYGGFETFAMEVSPRIAALGHEVLVVGSSVGRSGEAKGPPGVKIRNLPLRANGAASIPFDILSFLSVCRWADAVLLLGVSAGPVVPLMRRATRGGRLVVNVDGLESRRNKWSSVGRGYLARAEALAIQGALQVVADNEGIADIIRERYRRTPAVIAYGYDHVIHLSDDQRDEILQTQFGLRSGDYLLTVARIEPENNIEMMLQAAIAHGDIPYAILGNFDSSPYGRELWARFGDHPCIRLIAANYSPTALAALRSGCKVYLHGHSVGGTNPSLVEMLPYERPVLAFDCPYNRYTLDNSGAFFSAAEELQAILASGYFARHVPAGRLRDDGRYKWQSIAERYAALAFEG